MNCKTSIIIYIEDIKRMYQDFKDTVTPCTNHKKIEQLRQQLISHQVDGFLIPHEDEFMGEYIPPHSERLKWLTGFNGSAGIAVVLPNHASIFVDGRYVLQVQQQVNTDIFEISPLIHISLSQWLQDHCTHNAILGYDPKLHSIQQIEKLSKELRIKNIVLKHLDQNPLDNIWEDRPIFDKTAVHIHPHQYTGETSMQKRLKIAQHLKEQKIQSALLTQSDSIAWLLNIRGKDVPHTPLALSHALLHHNGDIDWFIHPNRLSTEVQTHIGTGLKVIHPDDMETYLKTLKNNPILMNAHTTPQWFTHIISNKIQYGSDPCSLPKACKNKTEISGAKSAHLRDATALCRFLCWLDTEISQTQITEISAAQKLEAFRQETNQLCDLSFDTISGTGENGAIIHYRVTYKTNRILKSGDIYLVDSGGQYKDGTTDVTRSILIKGAEPPTDARLAFTHVLKGHIALATARFPAGTNGIALDALARTPLWKIGMNFDHGTGHGVGSYLSVHEGPQNISKNGSTPLEIGMIISNEPGYYRNNSFGIRIENLQHVIKIDNEITEYPMLGFEILTLAPIDKNLIDKSYLMKDELEWLNNYHQHILETVSPYVDDTTQKWLKKSCSPIT